MVGHYVWNHVDVATLNLGQNKYFFRVWCNFWKYKYVKEYDKCVTIIVDRFQRMSPETSYIVPL